ncbi:MAG: hypothetical protein ACXW0T_06625 [Methylobacter sp.]
MNHANKQIYQPENKIMDNNQDQNHQVEGIFMTEEEYLISERISEVKHEYIGGQAYAMVLMAN